MGYFDSINNSGFLHQEDGRVAFYPFGVFAKGYLLTPDQASEARRGIARANYVGLPLIIVVTALGFQLRMPSMFGLLFALCVAWGLYYRHLFRRVTNGAERTAGRMSLQSNVEQMAERAGWPVTLLLFLGSLVFVIAGGIMFAAAPGPERWVGLISIAFFGFGLYLFSRQLAHLLTSRRSN